MTSAPNNASTSEPLTPNSTSVEWPPAGWGADSLTRIVENAVIGRGWKVELTSGRSDRRVVAPGADGGPPPDWGEVLDWIKEHPAAVPVLLPGLGSRVVSVTAVGVRAMSTLNAAMPSSERPFVLTAGPYAAEAVFAFPPNAAVFERIETRPSDLILAADGDTCDLTGYQAEPRWLEDDRPVPSLPAGLADEVGAEIVPIDGTPRFVELGRVGPAPYWWSTRERLRRYPRWHADGDDAVGTICTYTRPDALSPHVADLLLESDYTGPRAFELARRDAVLEVQEMIGFGVPPSAIAVMFTGGKSFHVRLWYAAFGQNPGPSNNLIMRRVAERLFGRLARFDRSLFDRRHKSRLLGTRHGKTGLWSVPVSIDELQPVREAELKDRARFPPALTEADQPDPEPVRSLAAIWLEEAGKAETDPGRRSSTPRKPKEPSGRRPARVSGSPPTRRAAARSAAKLADEPACVAALRSRTGTPSGKRNVVSVAIVAYARTRQLKEIDRRRLYKDVAANLGSADLSASQREQRLVAADRSAAVCRDDTYVFAARSCQTLRDAGLPCAPACPMRALWKNRRRPGVRFPEPLPEGVEPLVPAAVPAGSTLEEMLQQVRNEIATAVLAPKRGGPVVLVRAPPGTGKTTITLREVLALIARVPGRFRVLWASDRHDLLAALEGNWPGLVHVPRRSPENCDRWVEIEALTKAGWGGAATASVCLRCPRNPRRLGVGSVPCEYQVAVQDRTAPHAVVHEWASLTDVAMQFSYVVIDEDVLSSCLRERRYRPSDLERAVETLVGASEEQTAVLRRAVRVVAELRLKPESLTRLKLREALGVVDAAAFADDVDRIDWKAVGPTRRSGLDAYADRVGFEGLQPAGIRRPPVNPKPLLLALRDVLRGRAAAVEWDGSGWRVMWVEQLRTGNRPVLVLDATADPVLLERVLGRRVDVRDLRVPFTGPVLQIVNGRYPRATFFERTSGGPVLRRRALEQMIRVVVARAARVDGPTLLVTYKSVVAALRTAEPGLGPLPANVEVAWFGAVRGADLSGYRQIILLGFPFAKPDDVLFAAQALHQGDEEIDEATAEEVVPYAAINDFDDPADNPVGHEGGPVGLRLRRYIDPRVERVRRMMEDSEYWQTINRIRQINDPAKITVLLTSMPIPREHAVAVRLVEVDRLLADGSARGEEVNAALEAAAAVLDELGFVAVWVVAERRSDLGLSTVRRAVLQLAAERGLPRLALRRRTGRGAPRRAYGDADACSRYPGHEVFEVTVRDGAEDGPDADSVTSRNDVPNDFLPDSVEDLSSTAGEKKSGGGQGTR